MTTAAVQPTTATVVVNLVQPQQAHPPTLQLQQGVPQHDAANTTDSESGYSSYAGDTPMSSKSHSPVVTQVPQNPLTNQGQSMDSNCNNTNRVQVQQQNNGVNTRQVCYTNGQASPMNRNGFDADAANANVPMQAHEEPISTNDIKTESPQLGSMSAAMSPMSEESIQSYQSSLNNMLPEAKLDPVGDRLKLVEQVIETVVQAHLDTCNYTAEKVQIGLQSYFKAQEEGRTLVSI